MKRGYLSEYFEGVAVKRLSCVEADVLHSNQHEFNGVEGLRTILGEPDGKVRYDARLLYLTDQDADPIMEDAVFTWYDARQRARIERNVQRWEYRLYFPTTNVSLNAAVGDLLVIAKRQDGGLLVIIAENGSSIARQIEWLFGLNDLTHPGFSIKAELETEQDRIGFASRFVLESIGIAVEASEETFLEEMLHKFDGKFPTTRSFSEYARSTLPEIRPRDNPDAALMAWMEREEILFRTMERYLIADRLSAGFNVQGQRKVDVDGFLTFSLSVQNRRKSRVGLALENHLEVLLMANGVRYSRTAATENKSKPDFLFPGVIEYHDRAFLAAHLTMLGVKSTCKDRWRQVLSEADRISEKHLLTLETAISQRQTDEMRSKGLQLVLPQKLHGSYTASQQTWLLDITQFLSVVLGKQDAK
ncbi:Type-2 restriction enzyme EcoRII [Caballeronia pedi]|uniref:Type-2 restriction enzyme EcoRII n=1 Tax=Caballeronia pedi TaxID=1777141 RepID=A0A158D5H3_9BURK|nr:type II restriction endonuclease [Caballeronia pedi]SAK89838.1 Type-2 restriction enzyme EcoRII [Caballeronia pedi]